MNDPSTYWLTFTNVALGLIVLICCVVVAVGVLQEAAARRQKRAAAAELDRELEDLAAAYMGGHTFQVPGLGVTMADGGEEVKTPKETRMFLKETHVKYCQTAALRTMIPLAQAASAQEKCSSGRHVGCAVYRTQEVKGGADGPCPYLRESLMQYCSAAPVTKFIPYSESLLSRCGSDGHRYCQLYLGMAHPGLDTGAGDELATPPWLLYSDNHMWLDLTGDGMCHVGVDSFAARVLGKVEAITYVHSRGRVKPSAVLRSSGLDFEITFPNYVGVTACNLYLRAEPGRLVREPYAGGWLFEGTPEEGTAENLRSGGEAQRWMQEEARHMNEYLQQCTGVAADGGLFSSGLPACVDRESARALFHEFFSLSARETRKP